MGALAGAIRRPAVSGRRTPSVAARRPGGAAFAFAGPECGTVQCGRMWDLLKEFLQFLRQEKKWWLVPLVLILVGLAAVLIFGSSSGIAWAIYPFM